ncbi:MAG: hypothetical protein HY319_07145 [Armatimonadetes bacterium]|nr:hypothetical protein [Armatimonadota bacterium]
MRAPGRRGVTLIEVAVTVGLFSLVAVVLALAIQESSRVYRQLSSETEAQSALRQAELALDGDLRSASIAQMATALVPDSLGGGGNDGSALWFLSPRDPVTGVVHHKADGSPFWQRNILYYLVVPADHDQLFGYTCTGGAGPGGMDDRCPHKVLIRKVIDLAPATDPADEATEETLLPEVTDYLTRPAGYDTSGMSAEPGLQEVSIVARKLIFFRVTLAPVPASWPNEVEIDVRATSIEEAEKSVRVGSVALGTGPFTTQQLISVFTPND